MESGYFLFPSNLREKKYGRVLLMKSITFMGEPRAMRRHTFTKSCYVLYTEAVGLFFPIQMAFNFGRVSLI